MLAGYGGPSLGALAAKLRQALSRAAALILRECVATVPPGWLQGNAAPGPACRACSVLALGTRTPCKAPAPPPPHPCSSMVRQYLDLAEAAGVLAAQPSAALLILEEFFCTAGGPWV